MLSNQNCTLKADCIYWVTYPDFTGKHHTGEKTQRLMDCGKVIAAVPVSARDIKQFEIEPE